MSDRDQVRLTVKSQSNFVIKDDHMNYSAFDENEEPACPDPECDCRSAIAGHGETIEEAKADFWEQWEERNEDVA